MTKDEAWEAFKFTIYSDQPFTAIEEAADAYAQAAVDAFKADTLGMLRRLHSALEDYAIIENAQGNGQCMICGEVEDHKSNCVLAEAEALLAGKGEKE